MPNSIFEEGDMDDLLSTPEEKQKPAKAKVKAKSRAKAKTKAKVQMGKQSTPVDTPVDMPVDMPVDKVVAVAPDTLAARRGAGGKIRKYAPGETRVITIQKERVKGGDEPVPVCYNGKQFTVPRGVRIEVPAPIAEILMNAEETVMEWIPDLNTIEGRQAASYPTAIHN